MKCLMIALLAVLLTGCRTWQYGPYTPSSGGYEDRALSPRVYEVQFTRRELPMWEFFLTMGVSVWPFLHGDSSGRWVRQRGDMLRLRAAQLSLELGYAYFAIHPTWPIDHRRLVINVLDHEPDAETPKVYTATEVQRELLGDYSSLEVQSVDRAPDPAWPAACHSKTVSER
jgi:hypothetical protein